MYKKVIESTIDTMTKDADDLARKAQKRHDFALHSKSKACREKVSEKTEESRNLRKETG